MNIEVIDHIAVEQPVEKERVQFIIDALNSLSQFQTAYYIFGEDDLPENRLGQLETYSVKDFPITLVNDEVVKTAHYPTNGDFMHYSGITFELMTEEEYGHGCHHENHLECGGCCCGDSH